MKDHPGIYLIVNLVNFKVYVGSSVRVLARMVSHRSGLNKEKHNNRYLLSAWNKYGANSFMFEVVEWCTVKDRLKIEQRWIEKLRSNDRRFGYNVAYPVRSLLPSPAMSKVSKKSWKDPETGANRRAGIAKAWEDLEFRERKAQDFAKGRENAWANWKDPKFRAEQSAIRSAQWDDLEWRAAREADLLVKSAKGHTPEAKAKRSATMQALWDDPEYKAKHRERLVRNARAMTAKRMAKRASKEIV